jgi:hypothetical protein
VPTHKTELNMKSDPQAPTPSGPSLQGGQDARVSSSMAEANRLSTPLISRSAPNARPAFQFQPRALIKIKPMTPFFLAQR